MCPQSAALPADIGFQCTNEELCMSLEKIMRGSPLPGNVLDVNPYRYEPSNLPDGFWYFIRSNENKAPNVGYWRAKGEACTIFTNSSITGWRATLEFYEAHAPHESKTNWLMQEYWLTQKTLSEDINSKESPSLCRVFVGDDQKLNCKKLQEVVNSVSASHSTHPVVARAERSSGHGSTSKPQVSKDSETGTLTVTERLPHHNVEIIPENDYISRGDFLELLDLDTPASNSFSSVSSCLTMSSDECFDSLALLEELGSQNRQDSMNKDAAGCKFSISAPLKADELVMYAASSGSINKSPSEERVTEKTSNNMSKKQKTDYRNEGPSNSHNVAVSLSNHRAAPEAEKKESTAGRTKKLKKYFCFMPF